MIKYLILLFSTFLTVSCLSPTPYQSKSNSSSNGFSIKKLSEQNYIVSFDGNEETSRERANDFALLRAAQLSLSNGYQYMTIKRSKIVDAYSRNNSTKDTATPIRVVQQDGRVTYTSDYNTHFGSVSKKHAIARPRAFTIVEFLEDNYDQDKEIFDVNEIIRAMSKKYKIKLQVK